MEPQIRASAAAFPVNLMIRQMPSSVRDLPVTEMDHSHIGFRPVVFTNPDLVRQHLGEEVGVC